MIRKLYKPILALASLANSANATDATCCEHPAAVSIARSTTTAPLGKTPRQDYGLFGYKGQGQRSLDQPSNDFNKPAQRPALPSEQFLPHRQYLHQPYLHWYDYQDRRPQFYYDYKR